MKKLNGEKRISGRLLLHQPGQWRRLRRVAVKRISNQLPKVLVAQRRERELLDLSAVVPDRFEFTNERMRGIDLVVPIGPDQQQML